MVWGIWLDLMKNKYIENGRFEKVVKRFLDVRRMVYSAMFIIYAFFFVCWGCVLFFSDGKHSQEKSEVVYKVHEMGTGERLVTSFSFLMAVSTHALAVWLDEKLNGAKELLIIEQEDVIVQLSDKEGEGDGEEEMDDSESEMDASTSGIL